MKTEYAWIGLQECRKIANVKKLDPKNHAHVVRFICTFYYFNHFCIVLELLHASLLQVLTERVAEKGMLRFASTCFSRLAWGRKREWKGWDPISVLRRNRGCGKGCELCVCVRKSLALIEWGLLLTFLPAEKFSWPFIRSLVFCLACLGVGLSVSEIRKVAIQLLTSFAFLRRANIIHADLKPENVLLVHPHAPPHASSVVGILVYSIPFVLFFLAWFRSFLLFEIFFLMRFGRISAPLLFLPGLISFLSFYSNNSIFSYAFRSS